MTLIWTNWRNRPHRLHRETAVLRKLQESIRRRPTAGNGDVAWRTFLDGLRTNPQNKVVIVDVGLRADKEMLDANVATGSVQGQIASYRLAIADYRTAIVGARDFMDIAGMKKELAIASAALDRLTPHVDSTHPQLMEQTSSINF